MTERHSAPLTKEQLPPEQIIELKRRFGIEAVLPSFAIAYLAAQAHQRVVEQHPDPATRPGIVDLAASVSDYAGHLETALQLPGAAWPEEAVSTVELGELLAAYDGARNTGGTVNG